METNGSSSFGASNGPEQVRTGPAQSDMQRQLDALNMAERLRASSVSAAGNVANSSAPGPMLPPSSLGIFLAQANPSIGPLFTQDEVRGKPVLLRMIAELHNRKGAPLPPALTGIQTPMWNPATSSFRFELGADRGVVKIAGQDVDLFKLWQILFASGLSTKITREGTWPQVVQQLGLAPTLPDGSPTATQVQSLCAIFSDLEMFLIRLMQNHASQARRQQQAAANPQAQPATTDGDTPMATGGTPAASAPTPTHSAAAGGSGGGGRPETPAPGSASDDSDSKKRKAEDGDEEMKRAKFRKIEEDGATGTPNAGMETGTEPQTSTVKEEPQPEGPLLRRKIEYMPVMRTINTYGGRDLDSIEAEYQILPKKRPMRKMEDFGMVDVETLILQIRSRLKLEVATALGLLYHLAFIRGGDRGNSGLQLAVCEDLTDELLELLEETAFGNVPDVDEPEDADMAQRIITNRELTRNLQDEGDELFGGIKADQRTGSISPVHQPWEVIVMITTIIATVASADENPPYLAARPRLVDIMTRLCMLKPPKQRGETPVPLCSALQLRHVLRIRKDVVSLMGVLARHMQLSDSPRRATRRLYLLLAATLSDSDECIPPGTAGRPPSPMVDLALDTFTQIIHPDSNRKIISAEIPWEILWSLMMNLTRILPITDLDIQTVVNSEVWLSFVLKASLGIYSLAVTAPFPMRRKMKMSASLRGALTRYLKQGSTAGTAPNMVHRTLPPEVRATVEEYWKRVGETLKVIDAEEDPLAVTSSAGGLIGYGLGGSYDLHLGAKPPARGTGMFGGNREELLWSVLLTSAVQNDTQAFEEWDYMLRVDSSAASRA